MDMEMTGKVALVAGATSGIGKATAEMFARAGASVVLAGRRENLLREITESLKKEGCSAAYVVCDVTDEKQVENMIRFTADTFGRLDCAYNNAGIMSDDVETAARIDYGTRFIVPFGGIVSYFYRLVAYSAAAGVPHFV